MNRIEVRNGKFFLMPENKEISKNSVLAIKFQIREGKRLLGQIEKEVQSHRELIDDLSEKARQGIITAGESLVVEKQLLAKSEGRFYRIQKELDDLEFSLEIAENKPEEAKSKATKKDHRYWIENLFNEEPEKIRGYKNVKREIEQNGAFIIHSGDITVKVYTPELAAVFANESLEMENLDSKAIENVIINEYLKTYIDSFVEGKQFYKENHGVSPNIIYGGNAEEYIRDIHLNYFHTRHNGTNEGWVYVKQSYPIILTHKAIKNYGYYSGIVSEVEEQVKKYPKQFAKFDKCEHSSNVKQKQAPEPTSLSEIITHEKAEEIVSEIKIKYKRIKGKRLKLLLLALQELELLPRERIAKKFHNLCKDEFDWEIASYNAMNGYNYNEYADSEDINSIKEFLESIIDSK